MFNVVLDTPCIQAPQVVQLSVLLEHIDVHAKRSIHCFQNNIFDLKHILLIEKDIHLYIFDIQRKHQNIVFLEVKSERD